MDAVQMLRAQQDLRRSWLDLDEPPRRRLRVQRPNPAQMIRWRDEKLGGWARQLDKIAAECVVDWDGFTEADLLGAAQAPPAPQPFTQEVLMMWLQDELDVQVKIGTFALELYGAFEKTKADAAKN